VDRDRTRVRGGGTATPTGTERRRDRRDSRRVRLHPSRFARTHQFRLFIHVSDGSEFKVVGMREIPQFRRDA